MVGFLESFYGNQDMGKSKVTSADDARLPHFDPEGLVKRVFGKGLPGIRQEWQVG